MELTRIAEVLFSLFVLFIFIRNTWIYAGSLDSGLFSRIHFTAQALFLSLSFIGIFLSLFNQLGNIFSWNSLLLLLAFLFPKSERKTTMFRFPKSYLTLVYLVIFALGLTRAVFNFPNNFDSLTAHISRTLQYVQSGSFSITGSNYWAQDIHPINFCSAQIYAFLISKSIYVFQPLSVIWGILLIIQTKIILDSIGIRSTVSRLTLLGIAASTNFLIAFSSSGNDIYLAFAVWGFMAFLIQYHVSKNILFLLMAFLSLSNSVGIKQTSILALISFLPVIVFVVFCSFPKLKLTHIPVLIIGFVLACYSYIRNYLLFNDYLGSKVIVSFHTGNINKDFLLHEGYKNVLRYIFDIFSMDGLYFNLWSKLFTSKLVHFIKIKLHFLLSFANVDLTKGPLRDFYWISKPSSMSEFEAWFGVYGILVVLPVVLFGWLAFRKIRSWFYTLFWISAIMYLLANSFLSYYEIMRCRNFILYLPFVVVLSSFLIQVIPTLRLYFNFILIILIFNMAMVLLLNERNPFIGSNSIFTRPDYKSIYELHFEEEGLFERIKKEVSNSKNIGVCTPPVVDVFFYGNHFQNKVYYFRSWFGDISVGDGKRIDKLFFTSNFVVPQKGDRYLGVIDNLRGYSLYVRDNYNQTLFTRQLVKP